MKKKFQLTGNQSVKIIFTCLAFLLCGNIFAQASSDASLNSTITEEGLSQTEIVSYIAMIVGFSVIVAFAWFTSIRAKKRSEEEAHHHHAIAGGHRMHHGHHAHHDPYRKARKRSR
jgi:hypothetical protein